MANEPKVTKLTPAKPAAVKPDAEQIAAAATASMETAAMAVSEAAAPAASAETAMKAALAPVPEAATLANKTIDTSVAKTRTAMEKSMDQATRTTEGFYKATEEAVEFGRGNIEALTKATQTYVTGLQDLSKQAFAVMQAMNEQAIANAKALATVKSLKEAAELQSSFAKAQLEKSISEATKLNEAAFKLAEQSSAPIAARMTLAMEKMARPAAMV
ncbi:phasin family protein [Pseudoroseomonas cervicalis]|nr:phasin family protein [Pseudoroseomonas cervicalis]